MKKVHFISGLGADSRSFGFLDLSFCDAHFVKWIMPYPADTVASYAERLFEQIGDEEATIIGLSFGGMLATEIAKKHKRIKVIIIASAKTFREIPGYLRFWRHLPIYKLHSNRLKSYSGNFILSILGTKGAEQKKVQQQILRDSDPAFTRWAMHAIVTWRNIFVPENVMHIHGTADKLLPYRLVKANFTIKDGEHVMIMDRAAEVSELLKQLIQFNLPQNPQDLFGY